MNPYRALKAVLWRKSDPLQAPGRAWLQLEKGHELEAYFAAIPSETSIHERMFLYFFAKEMLDRGNILELGPFLGGTTRALACGIRDSKNAARRLFTIDQFDNYYSAGALRQLGFRLDGAWSGQEKVPFQRIFEHLHQGEPYYPIIEVQCLKIADLPQQKTDYAFLNKCGQLEAVFVDGCKSWYSVKDFVKNVAGRCLARSYFLFQDYGRYTCFWIPLFLQTFAEHFRLVGSVGSTYVFRMEKLLCPSTIDARYPDNPKDMDRSDAEMLFTQVFEREKSSGRFSGMVTARIQAAGFLAYVGETTSAREKLLALQKEKYVKGHLRKRVEEALLSPTYSPEGKIWLSAKVAN